MTTVCGRFIVRSSLEGGVVGLGAKTSVTAVLDDEVPDDDEYHAGQHSTEERSGRGRRRR